MDRNKSSFGNPYKKPWSLSARRAWIEIGRWQTISHCAPRSLSARRAWIEIIGWGFENQPTHEESLSARRAWIEIPSIWSILCPYSVALRKESVDRNKEKRSTGKISLRVALRKESVDRNLRRKGVFGGIKLVALRKESVDRNVFAGQRRFISEASLSARRAWIEMTQWRL